MVVEVKKEINCSHCGKQGRINADNEVVAYGCFFCSPVSLPLKHGIRKLDVKYPRKIRR